MQLQVVSISADYRIRKFFPQSDGSAFRGSDAETMCASGSFTGIQLLICPHACRSSVAGRALIVGLCGDISILFTISELNSFCDTVTHHHLEAVLSNMKSARLQSFAVHSRPTTRQALWRQSVNSTRSLTSGNYRTPAAFNEPNVRFPAVILIEIC